MRWKVVSQEQTPPHAGNVHELEAADVWWAVHPLSTRSPHVHSTCSAGQKHPRPATPPSTTHPIPPNLFISNSQLKGAVDVAHQFWCILTPFLKGLPQTFCLRDLLFQQKNWLCCIRPLINMGRTASEGKHLRLSNPKAVISAVHEGKPKNKTMTSGRCKRCSLSWGRCSEQLGVEGAYIKDQVILRAGGGGGAAKKGWRQQQSD